MSKGKLSFLKAPLELFRLPLKGCYEFGIAALVFKFGENGLRMSNTELAGAFFTDKRTIEKAISRLRKKDIIKDVGMGKNDRCLLITDTALKAVGDTELMPVRYRTKGGQIPPLRGADTALTYDHNIRHKGKLNKTNGGPPLPADGQAARRVAKRKSRPCKSCGKEIERTAIDGVWVCSYRCYEAGQEANRKRESD